MITIALPKKFGSKGFVTTVEFTNVEEVLANRINWNMYNPYEVRRGNIAFQIREID